MKHNFKFYQCTLEKHGCNNVRIETAWICAKYAHVGNVVRICGIDGWKIKAVGAGADKLPDWRKAIRIHETATGDNLPKAVPCIK